METESQHFWNYYLLPQTDNIVQILSPPQSPVQMQVCNIT